MEKQFEVGQKLYYVDNFNITHCEIVGFKNDNIVLSFDHCEYFGSTEKRFVNLAPGLMYAEFFTTKPGAIYMFEYKLSRLKEKISLHERYLADYKNSLHECKVCGKNFDNDVELFIHSDYKHNN